MGRFISLLGTVLLVGALALLVALKVDLPLVATLVTGLLCLGWLVTILVLPWNLFFRARHLLSEMQLSERRGIAVDGEARTEARKVATRMLRISVALHVGTALLLAGGAWLFHQHLAYAFAGLFLLSTLFRPGAEYYRYLSEKLGGFLREVKVPREDAVQLAHELRALSEQADAQRRALQDAAKAHHGLEEKLLHVAQAAREGDQEQQRKLDAVARKFEETVDRLTDNQEIISGIKAFLRLVQQPAREA